MTASPRSQQQLPRLSTRPVAPASESCGVSRSTSVSSPASAASPGSGASTPAHTPGASASQPHLAIKPSSHIAVQATTAKPVNMMAMTSVITPNQQAAPMKPPMSVTSKEWVIPPRPKPGRKPATDTPPTKRKAQNRAAQRAFRERRAARVGELEEQLEEQKEAHDKVEQELRDKVQGLEVETQTLRTRCQVLENMLERERVERARVGTELESMKARKASEASLSRSGSTSSSQPLQRHHSFQHQRGSTGNADHYSRSSRSSTTSVAAPRPSAHTFSISQIISPPDELDDTLTCGSCKPTGPCACADEVLAKATSGCGKCSLGTKCECLEESVNATLGHSESSSPVLKRPFRSSSPLLGPDEKRFRPDTEMETDFTSLFSRKRTSVTAVSLNAPAQPPTSNSTSYFPIPSTEEEPQPMETGIPKDPCGFCEEGTYCVCADAMRSSSSAAPPPAPPPQSAAIQQPTSLMSAQEHTPPPSEDDVVPSPMEVTATGAIKLPSLKSLRLRRDNSGTPAKRSTCGPGGPGTCAQCLADPKSGLFCRSLAANFERQGGLGGSGGGSGGCCGGGGAGGCCKSKGGAKSNAAAGATSSGAAAADNSSRAGASKKQQQIGLSLSCAETYKTLASHRHFSEATDDIGTWLPLLRAAPRPDPRQLARGGGGGERAPGGGSKLHPMEVEAASIMSVLKGFDVRFGE